MRIWRWRAKPPRVFALDRVWLVPAERPPHKQGVTHAPYADRFAMVELACRDEPKLEASRLEQGTASSYSIDTIEKVRARLAPGDKLFFVIGADAFAEIESWRRWQDVVRAVEFIVVSRPGHRYDIPAAATVHRWKPWTCRFRLPKSGASWRLATIAWKCPPRCSITYARGDSIAIRLA
jgi:nicotinate (nicotinamide) nucleotide adenylyltransferase